LIVSGFLTSPKDTREFVPATRADAHRVEVVDVEEFQLIPLQRAGETEAAEGDVESGVAGLT